MNWKKLLLRQINSPKLWLLVSGFGFLVPGFGFGQNSEETLALAQWNFSQKNFDESIEECERIVFFEERKNILAETHFQLAKSFLEKNQYESAYDNFNKVQQFCSTSDSIFMEAEFGKIMSHIARGDAQFAIIPLMDLKSGLLSAYFQKKKLFYAAVVNYQVNSWDASERDFIDLLNNDDSLKVSEIFKQVKKIHKKINPKKAKILSMIMPGAGQLYLGDYKNALNSFLLNGTIVATGVYWAGVYTVVDAYFFTANWFFRYYKGGYLRAKMTAEEKLFNADNLYLNQLMGLAEKKLENNR